MGKAREGLSGEGKRERGRQTMVVPALSTILSGFRSYAGSDLFSPKKGERKKKRKLVCVR